MGQSKQKNQTPIWQRCWNYQTGNLKQTMIKMLRTPMAKVRWDAKTWAL